MTNASLQVNRHKGRLEFDDPARATFSAEVKRRSPYRVIDGRIVSEALEIPVTEHCNLSCRSCSHLSPVFRKNGVDPAEVEADLSLLARHYNASHVRLVGGEPLLHPRLLDLIAAIRRSRVSERIRLISNGTLTHLMTPEFWAALDEVHISIYPGKELSQTTLDVLKNRAMQYGTSLVIKNFDKFRETYAEEGTSDSRLVARIFQSCQIAHTWRCHTVAQGYFYLCPQSAYVPRLLTGVDSDKSAANGLKITADASFGPEILKFLERDNPLSACSSCLGSVGKIFRHEEIRRSLWRLSQKYSTEELIDWNFLEGLESNPDAHNDCFETVHQ
jgi:organic radical activating enzyme